MNLGKESETLEFKKTTGELKEAMISISSILNKHGVGTLYFGVKPNGDVIGQDVSESSLRDVSRFIYESIKPQIYPVIQERASELAKKAESIWPYPSLTDAELAPYQVEEKPVQKYSLETYDVNAFTRILFESLDKRIMNLSPNVKKEYKKLYVAYKLDTNFVDIVFQKQRLRISINMKFSEINDPNGICKDITNLGRWGNGDVELFMEHQDELDQIMEIVKQSYDAQAE